MPSRLKFSLVSWGFETVMLRTSHLGDCSQITSASRTSYRKKRCSREDQNSLYKCTSTIVVTVLTCHLFFPNCLTWFYVFWACVYISMPFLTCYNAKMLTCPRKKWACSNVVDPHCCKILEQKYTQICTDQHVRVTASPLSNLARPCWCKIKGMLEYFSAVWFSAQYIK